MSSDEFSVTMSVFSAGAYQDLNGAEVKSLVVPSQMIT